MFFPGSEVVMKSSIKAVFGPVVSNKIVHQLTSHVPFRIVACTVDISGQIIATSRDLTPNGGLVREIPLFQGNLGW